VSYSDAAETDSVRPISPSARASSSGVTTTEGGDVEVDGEVIAELIQNFVSMKLYKKGHVTINVMDNWPCHKFAFSHSINNREPLVVQYIKKD